MQREDRKRARLLHVTARERGEVVVMACSCASAYVLWAVREAQGLGGFLGWGCFSGYMGHNPLSEHLPELLLLQKSNILLIPHPDFWGIQSVLWSLLQSPGFAEGEREGNGMCPVAGETEIVRVAHLRAEPGVRQASGGSKRQAREWGKRKQE